MLDAIIAPIALWIIAVISTTGYAGVVGLMAIESACVPLPSEIIMPFAGYLASTGRFNLALVATAGAIGCNVGSVLPYWVGAHGGRRMAERWGRYVLLSHRDLDLTDAFFKRYGALAVLIARMLPVVRSFIALPAGIARMNQVPFHIYTFVGSWPWCFGLAYIGYALGEAWDRDPRLKEWMHRFDILVAAALLAGLAWYVWRHLKHREG